MDAREIKLPKETDIISYRPILEIEKEIKTKSLDDTNEEQLYEYSKAVLQVSENLPSLTLGTLERLKDNIISTMSFLDSELSNVKGNKLSFSDFKQALNDNNYNLVEQYLNAHKDSLKGDTRVEIYAELNDVLKETNELRSLYAKLIYGNSNITSKDASLIDDVKYNKLFLYEREGNENKINYGAISIDAQLQKVISGYAETLNRYSNELLTISTPTIQSNTKINTTSAETTLNNFFSDYVNKNNEDKKKLKSITERKMISTSMSNAYVKRKELLSLLNTKQSLLELSNYSSTISNSINDSIDKSYDDVIELNKVVLLNALYKDDYISTLKQKHELRNIYKLISNNL